MSSRSSKFEKIQDAFQLPRAITKSLRQSAGAHGTASPGGEDPLRYIWIHLSEKTDTDETTPGMELEHWLNVVDEAAGLGADSLFISVMSTLPEWSNVWELCRWAQDVHQMHVALYVYGIELQEGVLDTITQLDLAKLCLYVDAKQMARLRYLKEKGVTLCQTQEEDLRPDAKQAHECTMPQNMVCVGAEGAMYTCGLVLGKDEFFLGHACEQRFDNVMADDSLPHSIPEGMSRAQLRCGGCPPLMEKLHLEE